MNTILPKRNDRELPDGPLPARLAAIQMMSSRALTCKTSTHVAVPIGHSDRDEITDAHWPSAGSGNRRASILQKIYGLCLRQMEEWPVTSKCGRPSNLPSIPGCGDTRRSGL